MQKYAYNMTMLQAHPINGSWNHDDYIVSSYWYDTPYYSPLNGNLNYIAIVVGTVICPNGVCNSYRAGPYVAGRVWILSVYKDGTKSLLLLLNGSHRI